MEAAADLSIGTNATGGRSEQTAAPACWLDDRSRNHMRHRGKLIGWGIALATAATMLTAGTVYATTNTSQEPAPGSLTLEEMRSVLVPLSEQTQTRFVHGPMTMKEAAAENAFVAPPSMVFEPESCATYLEDVVGSLDTLDGWIQFGSRVHEDHNDNFIQAVAKVSDQLTLEKIRESAFQCRDGGTLTLEGQVTGKITYREREAPLLAGAETLAITGQTQFSEVPGTEGYELVARYEMPPDSQLLVNSEQLCIAATTFVLSGDTLIVTMEADPGYADALAGMMFGAAQQLQG